MLDEPAMLQVANTRHVPVTFCLEPFGAVSTMPPGSTWTVTARLADGERLAVEMDERAIVVRAGASPYAPVRVTQGETVVLDCGQPEVAAFDPYR